MNAEAVTIRRLGERERPRVLRLLQRDGVRDLPGPWLGAEADGRLHAVISLTTGDTAADPFACSAEVRALLELRAAQLRRRNVQPLA